MWTLVCMTHKQIVSGLWIWTHITHLVWHRGVLTAKCLWCLNSCTTADSAVSLPLYKQVQKCKHQSQFIGLWRHYLLNMWKELHKFWLPDLMLLESIWRLHKWEREWKPLQLTPNLCFRLTASSYISHYNWISDEDCTVGNVCINSWQRMGEMQMWLFNHE